LFSSLSSFNIVILIIVSFFNDFKKFF